MYEVHSQQHHRITERRGLFVPSFSAFGNQITSGICHTAVHACRDASQHPFRITQFAAVNKFILTFSWTAVLHARGEVLEAIGVALAAPVVEGLTLHGGHVEEVAGKEGTAGSLLFRKSADLGNFWGEEGQDFEVGMR